MNILILTGEFGMGHCSAAEAVREEILAEQPEAEVNVVDFIDYMFPVLNKIIYRGFNFMVNKCSGVYNFLNLLAAKYSCVPLKKVVAKKIAYLLEMYQADLVVATLPICSQYISAYKEMTGESLPLYTYITDITAHEEWLAQNTDRYFVGAASTKNSLVSKGVSADNIVVSGIPVKQSFREKRGGFSMTVRNGRCKEILIMGGGLGLIPSSEQFLSELRKQDNLHITMITGRNTKLMHHIREKFPEIKVIGYTERVAHYMEKADLIITKSGGITMFEAIHSHTPLYIIRPFLMQEQGNAQYIEQLNIGRVVWSKNTNIAEDVISLLRNVKLMTDMKNNMIKIQRQLSNASPLNDFAQRGGAA